MPAVTVAKAPATGAGSGAAHKGGAQAKREHGAHCGLVLGWLGGGVLVCRGGGGVQTGRGWAAADARSCRPPKRALGGSMAAASCSAVKLRSLRRFQEAHGWP